jgi:hypothetical protein
MGTVPHKPVRFYNTKGYWYHWDTGWRSWLRHYATSRKVADLNPDGVIIIFYLHNSSGGTMALASARPLTEMSTRIISWG